MFITVEGGNSWLAEEKLVSALIMEVASKSRTLTNLKGSHAFLDCIRSKPKLVNFLFVSGILSLVDSRMSMNRESAEVAYWLTEHRKVEGEHIILSDIFEVSYIDVRVRKLVTHRIRVTGHAGVVHYRVVALSTTRSVSGKLGEGSILDAIEKSNTPLTPEELDKIEKELEGTLSES